MGKLRGQKRSQIAHFSNSNAPEIANLHRKIIFYQRFDTITHLGQIKHFESFWGRPEHQMGVQKGQKLPRVLTATHKNSKFARVDKFS